MGSMRNRSLTKLLDLTAPDEIRHLLDARDLRPPGWTAQRSPSGRNIPYLRKTSTARGSFRGMPLTTRAHT